MIREHSSHLSASGVQLGLNVAEEECLVPNSEMNPFPPRRNRFPDRSVSFQQSGASKILFHL